MFKKKKKEAVHYFPSFICIKALEKNIHVFSVLSVLLSIIIVTSIKIKYFHNTESFIFPIMTK